MANPEHLAKLNEGLEAWDKWRADNRDVAPDLRGAHLADAQLPWANLTLASLESADLVGANLRDADLARANLTSAKLSGARLSGAKLDGAKLTWANLAAANLEDAVLIGARLVGTNLAGASMASASLIGATFNWANLDHCDLGRAVIGPTSFLNVDLSSVLGLAEVLHNGPSAIGVDTIYRSKGRIPEKFLRGCGVPEDFIKTMQFLHFDGTGYASCFISYSTKDQDFADRLYADLQNKGVRCWFAPHDIQSGKKIHEQIDEAIRLHDKLLLILSPHSMQSEWVKTEIAKARKRELRDQRRVLFPIRLAPFETLRDWECFDADTGKDSAREIREYFIPDFSNWKSHDSYQEAFQRLIGDLKASDAKQSGQ
jgi:hypothetical protein